MKEIKVVKDNPCDDCGIKGLYDNCKDECVQYRKYYQYQQGRVDAIKEMENCEEDVCEWKVEKGVDYYYTCGCIDKWYQQEDRTDWKYCPYCGKKIKVVE